MNADLSVSFTPQSDPMDQLHRLNILEGSLPIPIFSDYDRNWIFPSPDEIPVPSRSHRPVVSDEWTLSESKREERKRLLQSSRKCRVPPKKRVKFLNLDEKVEKPIVPKEEPVKPKNGSLDLLVNVALTNITSEGGTQVSWFDYFRALVEYRLKHGNGKVPSSFHGHVGVGLGKWVYRQKRDLMRYLTEDHRMTEKKIAQMEMLQIAGFDKEWLIGMYPVEQGENGEVQVNEKGVLEGHEDLASVIQSDEEWGKQFVKFVARRGGDRHSVINGPDGLQWVMDELQKYKGLLKDQCKDKSILTKAGFRYNLLMTSTSLSPIVKEG